MISLGPSFALLLGRLGNRLALCEEAIPLHASTADVGLLAPELQLVACQGCLVDHREAAGDAEAQAAAFQHAVIEGYPGGAVAAKRLPALHEFYGGEVVFGHGEPDARELACFGKAAALQRRGVGAP